MSLFEHDTCTPPCWFGLTPGKSTIQDVVNTFTENPDEFWVVSEDTPDRLTTKQQFFHELDANEQLEFLMSNADYGGHAILSSRIAISDNRIDYIDLLPPQRLTLGQVVYRLGKPNQVAAYVVMNTLYIYLYYTDLNLDVGLAANSDTCEMYAFSTNFRLDSATYYWPEGPLSIKSREFDKKYYYPVPETRWQSWLSGKLESTCKQEMVYTFMEDVDATATQSAAATLTAAPTATP
jgi:hypothetical protein